MTKTKTLKMENGSEIFFFGIDNGVDLSESVFYTFIDQCEEITEKDFIILAYTIKMRERKFKRRRWRDFGKKLKI